MTDKHNAEIDPKDVGFDDEYDTALTSELYTLGKDRLYSNGFLIIPDASGRYGYHKVYQLESILDDEIDYPDNFKVWAEISNENVRGLLQNVIAGWHEEDLKKFWWPMIAPNKNKNSQLYMYTELLLNDKGIYEKKNAGEAYNYYLTPKPVVADNPKDAKKLAPKTWIPLEEWFPESVKQVTIKDVLTLFPDKEQELLTLILGRGVVGRSNHLPPGWNEPIKHTSRMAALTLGEDPGLGKTSLFKTFFQALETVGYTIETFDKFNSQFNMGPILQADFVYRDDLTDKDLKSLLESGVAKSTISGSDQVKVQDKGVDAHNVFPKAVIIANTNNFNPRLIWNIDPGMADRIKLLATLREAELKDLSIGGVSEGSPDVRPFLHLPYLASKCGVTVKTLMLWFARLCADRFLELISDRTSLEHNVDRLTLRLREPLHKDSTSQLMTTALYMGCLFDTKVSATLARKPRSVSEIDWESCFKSTYDVLSKRKTYAIVLEKLKEDFEAQEIPDTLHPWLGVATMDPFSLKLWVVSDSSNYNDLHQTDRLAWLKEAMKRLRLQNGLHYSQDEVWLTKAFSKILYYNAEVRKKAKKFKDFIDIEELLIEAESEEL